MSHQQSGQTEVPGTRLLKEKKRAPVTTEKIQVEVVHEEDKWRSSAGTD